MQSDSKVDNSCQASFCFPPEQNHSNSNIVQIPPVVKSAMYAPVSRGQQPFRHRWTAPANLLPILHGQNEAARVLLTGLLMEYDTDQDVPSFLGSLLAFGKLGIQAKPIHAVIMLEKALKMNPKDVEALASLGGLLAFGAKGVPCDPKRAEQLLLAALDYCPTHARALTFLGSLLASGTPGVEENLELATEYLTQAIAIQQDPGYFEASVKSIFSRGNQFDLARALAFLGAIEAFFLGEGIFDKEYLIARFNQATRYDPNELLYQAWQGLYEEHTGVASGKNKVRAFFSACSLGDLESLQKMRLFRFTTRTNWAKELLKKY